MNKIKNLFKGDPVIWIIYFFLCVISLVEVYSAGSSLAYKNGSFWIPLTSQAMFLAVGTMVVIFFHSIPCRFFRAFPIFLYPVSVFSLLLVGVIGATTNGAQRWIDLGIFQFQPSELAKGAVIMSVALILAQTQRENGAHKNAFKLIVGLAVPVVFLIAFDNISTGALLLGVVLLMMIIGRVPWNQIGKFLGFWAILIALVVAIVAVVPSDSTFYKLPGTGRMKTAKSRIETKLNNNDKEILPEDYDIDKNAQVAHANIAIASSNFVGKMPGNSVERDFLSQAYSDFIYAIIIEETGLWGGLLVVFLYVVLLYRAGRIAKRCESNFPAFLAMGIALLLVCQAVLNMLVAVGLFPVTGQPLPMISRGGTSTLINSFYIGVLLSVSRYSRKNNVKATPAELSGETPEKRKVNPGLQPAAAK